MKKILLFSASFIIATALNAQKYINVTINQPMPPPASVITQTGNSLVSSSLTGNQWYEMNTGIISGATGQSFTISDSGSYFVIVTENYCWSDTSNIIVTNKSKIMQIKLFLQGFYNPVTQLLDKVQDENGDHFAGDTVDVINIGFAKKDSPHDITNTYHTAINTNGLITFNIPDSKTDSSYIVVRHRNHIETWSATAVSFTGDTIFYDFTNDSTKAFGNNLKNLNSNPQLYIKKKKLKSENDISDLKKLNYNPERFEIIFKIEANSDYFEAIITDKFTHKTYKKRFLKDDYIK